MTTPPKPVPPHPDVRVLAHTEAYRGRFGVERVRFQVRRFDGSLSPPHEWEVFQRGHAVAVLPYDPVRDLVVLIQQFRLPALMAGLDPWLIEVPAGVIEGEEAPEAVARRELLEETGQTVKRLERIGRYLPSPGGCSETITLFAGRIDAPPADSHGVAGHGGLATEHEDIRVLVVPAETALSWLAEGRIVNGTTFLALHWLALHRPALRARWRQDARLPPPCEDAMPTEPIFRDDPYAQACEARVLASGPEGVVLDRTVFYAQGGGQPGDTGRLVLADGSTIPVANAVKGAEPDTVLHQLAPGTTPPAPGTALRAEIDWARRHRLMRVHTSMHLLCSMIPGIAVTGGAVGDGKGRLDFDLPAAPDKDALNARLAELIAANHPVGTLWITEEELNARPEMVRTLSVKPPMGSGRVRLVRIGPEAAPVDLQPCGGTHVRATAEIGRAEIAKIENKGRQNRRINLVLID